MGQHRSSLSSATAPAACPEGSSHPCQPQQHRAEAEDWREPQDFDSAVFSHTPPAVPAAPQAGMWLRASCTPGWDIPEVSQAVARTWAASRLPRPALAPASPSSRALYPCRGVLPSICAQGSTSRVTQAHPEWHKPWSKRRLSLAGADSRMVGMLGWAPHPEGWSKA